MINVSLFVDNVIKRLDNYEEVLKRRANALIQKLSDIGMSVASVTFANAQYDGTNDVVVSTRWEDDNHVTILADGKAVTFIEFGTGVTYTEEHPLAKDMGAVRGEYGQGKGKNPNGWAYIGEAGTNGRVVRSSLKGDVVRTKGNPPARAMFLATEAIRQQVDRVAQEVFHD